MTGMSHTTGNLVAIPEHEPTAKGAPTLRVRTPGGSGPLFESYQNGLIIEIHGIPLDAPDIDWHALFHLALGKLAEERAASTDALLARFREAS